MTITKDPQNEYLHGINKDVKVSIFDLDNNYNYVEDTKVSVSIKKCQQMHIKKIFRSEIVQRLSAFYSGCWALVVDLYDC